MGWLASSARCAISTSSSIGSARSPPTCARSSIRCWTTSPAAGMRVGARSSSVLGDERYLGAARAARGCGRRAAAPPLRHPPGRIDPAPAVQRGLEAPREARRSDERRLDRCGLPRAPDSRASERDTPRKPSGRLSTGSRPTWRRRDPEAPERAPDPARRAAGLRDRSRARSLPPPPGTRTTGRSISPPASRSSERRSARARRGGPSPTRGASCGARSIGAG